MNLTGYVRIEKSLQSITKKTSSTPFHDDILKAIEFINTNINKANKLLKGESYDELMELIDTIINVDKMATDTKDLIHDKIISQSLFSHSTGLQIQDDTVSIIEELMNYKNNIDNFYYDIVSPYFNHLTWDIKLCDDIYKNYSKSSTLFIILYTHMYKISDEEIKNKIIKNLEEVKNILFNEKDDEKSVKIKFLQSFNLHPITEVDTLQNLCSKYFNVKINKVDSTSAKLIGHNIYLLSHQFANNYYYQINDFLKCKAQPHVSVEYIKATKFIVKTKCKKTNIFYTDFDICKDNYVLIEQLSDEEFRLYSRWCFDPQVELQNVIVPNHYLINFKRGTASKRIDKWNHHINASLARNVGEPIDIEKEEKDMSINIIKTNIITKIKSHILDNILPKTKNFISLSDAIDNSYSDIYVLMKDEVNPEDNIIIELFDAFAMRSIKDFNVTMVSTLKEHKVTDDLFKPANRYALKIKVEKTTENAIENMFSRTDDLFHNMFIAKKLRQQIY